MEDMMNKIGDILSDPESIKQITELAQMFMSGNLSDSENSSDGNSECQSENNDNQNNDIFSGIDFSKLMKLSEVVGAVSNKDKNLELLVALKPHLSQDRQKKVDKAIKLMKVIAIWNIVKESGLLKDFLDG